MPIYYTVFVFDHIILCFLHKNDLIRNNTIYMNYKLSYLEFIECIQQISIEFECERPRLICISIIYLMIAFKIKLKNPVTN